jgi:hypothetical protein
MGGQWRTPRDIEHPFGAVERRVDERSQHRLERLRDFRQACHLVRMARVGVSADPQWRKSWNSGRRSITSRTNQHCGTTLEIEAAHLPKGTAHQVVAVASAAQGHRHPQYGTWS